MLTIDLTKSAGEPEVSGKLYLHLSYTAPVQLPRPAPSGSFRAATSLAHLPLVPNFTILHDSRSLIQIASTLETARPTSAAAVRLQPHLAVNTKPIVPKPENALGPSAVSDGYLDELNPLPDSCERRLDQRSRPNYVDHVTQRSLPLPSSVALPPKTRLSNPDVSSDAIERMSNTQAAASAVHSGASLGPLPAGWHKLFNENGRPYYADDNTRTTSWMDPRRTLTPQAKSILTASNRGPLPSGWEMRLRIEGDIYFLDHSTRTTTWDDPRVPKPVEDSVGGQSSHRVR